MNTRDIQACVNIHEKFGKESLLEDEVTKSYKCQMI